MKSWLVHIIAELNGLHFDAFYTVEAFTQQEAARAGRMLFTDEYASIKGVTYGRLLSVTEHGGLL